MKTKRAQQKQTTLVLGGTGKTGRPVEQRLAALAVHLPRPRLGRFWLIALASALYVGEASCSPSS